MMRWRGVLPLVGLALVAACAGFSEDRDVEQRLATYVGATQATLLTTFGRPVADETDAAGRRKLTFYRSGTPIRVEGAYEQIAQQRPVSCADEIMRPSSCQKVEVKGGKDYYASSQMETYYTQGDWVPEHVDVWWCSVSFTLGADGKVVATGFSPYSSDQKINCQAEWPGR